MNRRFIRNESFLAEDLGDGILLLNTTDNVVVELNLTATRLWARLAQPATRLELAQELEKHYPGRNPAALAADADDFVLKATACKAIHEAGR